MTVLFMDGFEHYNTAAMAYNKWGGGGSMPNPNTAYGRHDQGVALRSSSADYLSRGLGSDLATIVVGLSLRVNAHTGGRLKVFLDSGTYQACIRTTSDGRIQAWRGSTTALLAETAQFTLTTGVWHHVETKITIDNTAGAVEVRLNGVTVINVSGVDTTTTANDTIDTFQLGPNDDVDIDNFYILDTVGTIAADFVGDCQVEDLYSSGAGNSSGWTPSAGSNYENVDEKPPDGDTTYNSDAATNKDTHAMDNLATTSGEVFAVQTVLYERKDDTGACEVRPVLRQGTTDYPGTNVALTESYGFDSEVFEDDPDTSAQWTIAGVNSVEAGYERTT